MRCRYVRIAYEVAERGSLTASCFAKIGIQRVAVKALDEGRVAALHCHAGARMHDEVLDHVGGAGERSFGRLERRQCAVGILGGRQIF